VPQLRIHFTDADIARTRLKLEIDPMWEIVSSVHILQHGDGGLSFDAWRSQVRERARWDHDLRSAVHTLVTVAPNAPYFPDFLTPALDVSDVDEGIDTVLSTPPRRLRAEIDLIRPIGDHAGWLDDLASGRSGALRHLRAAARVYCRCAMAPHLQVIRAALRIEAAERIQAYLREGPEGLLRRLGPATRWTPPVLTVDYPRDRDLYLAGRGLVLIPCYFCLFHPVALADPLLPPVLALPIQAASRLLAGEHGNGDDLGALLGATRATILRSVLDGNTTTGLASLTGVAPATISHHTGVLRNAGLIATNRDGNCARHCITPLGLRVLTAHD
jgi:DNA-binding transcriptional ArsR family regulator